MQYRLFGDTNIPLSAIGLGCMGMNHAYGQPDDEESWATLEKSIELGINFWDTADIYANGANETLISKVLKPNRSKIFLATKFGFKPYSAGSFGGFDGSPDNVRKAIDQSLSRLQTDVIDLYYAHRIDPNVPIEEMVGAMAELVHQGKVRYLGLSEASANTIRRAHAVHPISALQSEYSLICREVEAEILPLCEALNITFVPFSPLARGLMTNTLKFEDINDQDFRKKLPRYQKEYEANNQALASAFAQLAMDKGCTPAQLALAWVLAQGDHIIPIPGTKKRRYLQENVGAIGLELTDEELTAMEDIIAKYPHTGPRYNEENMKYVDKN
ncbi:MAG: aldo/keto reductase [Saprospiraceae bacterium]|nr:aldo/keto reductase [Saprospiraceae bacterium]MBK7608017.1 aldo/keto reductase [Saprospiraceae bacterium]MBK8510696.1 aldo/keto reductase [Saprospiraceae bacterium]